MNLKEILAYFSSLVALASIFLYTYSSKCLASPHQNKPILKAAKAKFDFSNKPLQGNAAYKVLKGGVDLSCSLPPIAPALKAGAIFSATNIPKTPKITDWYLIPPWLAGEWHRETMNILLFDFIPIPTTERADHLWGHQIDCLGGIWHHRNEPYVQTVETDFAYYSKTITLLEPVLISDSKVIMHYKDITVEHSKFNNVILRTFRHEQISEISKRGNQIFEEVRAKNFDDNGYCPSEIKAQTTYTMTKPFHPTDIDKNTNLNLREDFRLYLTAHGFSNRLPENQVTVVPKH